MKTIKSLTSMLFEQVPSRVKNTGGTTQPRRTTVVTNGNTKKDPPAAPTKISEADYNKLVMALDGFALYFSNVVTTIVKYNETSMGDCAGVVNDDEACYWKAIRQNYKMLGAPDAYTKFSKAVADFQKLIADDKVPNKDAANLVLTRVSHNLHEATRINFNTDKEYRLSNVPAGEKGDTLKGMVFKKINYDDHNFRWTMYYNFQSTTPYGGGAPTTVSTIQNYGVDCDL